MATIYQNAAKNKKALSNNVGQSLHFKCRDVDSATSLRRDYFNNSIFFKLVNRAPPFTGVA
ncbi:MAG: hypothetical protein AAB209_08925, partial [Bacteroidota bacterium]